MQQIYCTRMTAPVPPLAVEGEFHAGYCGGLRERLRQFNMQQCRMIASIPSLLPNWDAYGADNFEGKWWVAEAIIEENLAAYGPQRGEIDWVDPYFQV